MCDREVWRWLLQGNADFSKERVEVLAGFAGDRGPEVMGEVLRAAARRFEPFNRLSPDVPGRIQVSVSVDQGWGPPETFKLAEIHLRKLNTVAQTVGATYNIVEVDMAQCVPRRRCMALSSWFNVRLLRMIVNHVEEQSERMDSLKLCAWDSDQYPVSKMHFLSLLNVTKKWRIKHICTRTTDFVKFFADLPTDSAAAGQIDRIYIGEKEKLTSLDVMKRIWEISVTVCLCTSTSSQYIPVGGGRGENPEVGWQQFLDFLHGN